MWQSLGTVAIAAFGGSLLLHYLKNFTLKERTPLRWDWDGLVERSALVTLLLFFPGQHYLIPAVIAVRVIYRILLLGRANIARVGAPGAVFQKVNLKAELAIDLLVSPAFAILVGVIF